MPEAVATWHSVHVEEDQHTSTTVEQVEREPAFEAIKQETAEILVDTGAVGFDPHFDFDKPESDEHGFPFKSGVRGPMYMDCRVLPSHPEACERVSDLMYAYSMLSGLNQCDMVAGVASGGTIPAHNLSKPERLNKPNVTVREEKKDRGLKKQIEGASVEGQHVLVVEDVINRGTASLPAVDVLRRNGATVTDILAIASYGLKSTEHKFVEQGVTVHSLTDAHAVVEAACRRGLITREYADKVHAWLDAQDHTNEEIQT
jgi:orotate phosphoribosyltransferase